MNVSKTLTSTIAAAAIIGAISVAYAQTSQGDASPAQQNQTLENSNSTSQGGMSTPLPSDSSVPSYQGERPAQADRN